ncbi:MAG TPA: GspH/FimT family pseudopilin [Moraxellaceae bacterium]
MQGNKGFTLFEIMVTLAIIAILAAAGYPSMKTAVSTARMNRTASSLALAVAQARSQAIANNGFVSIVAGSTDSPLGKVTAPATETANTEAWSNGWRLLLRPIDTSTTKLAVNGTGVTVLGQEYLGFTPSKSASVSVKYVNTGTNTVVSGVIGNSINFNKLGQLVNESGAALTQDIQVWVCDGGRTGEKGRRIVINRRGNVKNLLVGASGYVNPC